MSSVRYDVRSVMSEELAERMEQAAGRAETFMATAVRKDTAPFVPMLTGSLNLRSRVHGNFVIYPGPYARFLYYGKVMVYPPTGSTWAPKGGRKVVIDRDLVFTKDFHQDAQAFWFEAAKAQNKEKWIREATKAFARYGRA